MSKGSRQRTHGEKFDDMFVRIFNTPVVRCVECEARQVDCTQERCKCLVCGCEWEVSHVAE